MNYKIRWMTQSDMESVQKIEVKSFPKPWSKKDFTDCLEVRSKIGKVIEVSEKIVGFIIYELMPKGFYIINIAIDPDYRRLGYGRALVSQLIEKVKQTTNDYGYSKRYFVNSYISDEKVDAHLFFKSLEFKAISIEKNFFNDEEGTFDAYHFIYKKEEPKVFNRVKANSIIHDGENWEGIE